MQVRFLMFLAALLVASPALADRSCAEVNKLYDDSRSVSRYQATQVWTPPGGTASNFVFEQRYNGRDMFVRDLAGNWWKNSRPYITVDTSYPTFSSCVRWPDTLVVGQKVITYTGDWQRGRRRAKFVLRAWAETGHVIDITRVMTLTYQGTPLDTKGVTAVDAFTYNRSVPNPTSYR